MEHRRQPRKFDEKIRNMNKKQEEDSIAVDRIIRESQMLRQFARPPYQHMAPRPALGQMCVQPPGSLEPPPLHDVCRFGSLPNLCINENSLDLPGALKTLDEMQRNTGLLSERRDRHPPAALHRMHMPYSVDRKNDMMNPNTSSHLQPPSESLWRRTASDSYLYHSANAPGALTPGGFNPAGFSSGGAQPSGIASAPVRLTGAPPPGVPGMPQGPGSDTSGASMPFAFPIIDQKAYNQGWGDQQTDPSLSVNVYPSDEVEARLLDANFPESQPHNRLAPRIHAHPVGSMPDLSNLHLPAREPDMQHPVSQTLRTTDSSSSPGSRRRQVSVCPSPLALASSPTSPLLPPSSPTVYGSYTTGGKQYFSPEKVNGKQFKTSSILGQSGGQLEQNETSFAPQNMMGPFSAPAVSSANLHNFSPFNAQVHSSNVMPQTTPRQAPIAHPQSTVPMSQPHPQSNVPMSQPHSQSTVHMSQAHIQSTVPMSQAHLQSTVPMSQAHLQSTVPMSQAHLQRTAPISQGHPQPTAPMSQPHPQQIGPISQPAVSIMSPVSSIQSPSGSTSGCMGPPSVGPSSVGPGSVGSAALAGPSSVGPGSVGPPSVGSMGAASVHSVDSPVGSVTGPVEVPAGGTIYRRSQDSPTSPTHASPQQSPKQPPGYDAYLAQASATNMLNQMNQPGNQQPTNQQLVNQPHTQFTFSSRALSNGGIVQPESEANHLHRSFQRCQFLQDSQDGRQHNSNQYNFTGFTSQAGAAALQVQPMKNGVNDQQMSSIPDIVLTGAPEEKNGLLSDLGNADLFDDQFTLDGIDVDSLPMLADTPTQSQASLH